MPPQQNKPAPDFIPDAPPDFIPDAGVSRTQPPLPEGVVRDSGGKIGSVAPPSTLSLYKQALFNPVGSGAHLQGVVGGAEQVGGRAMQTLLSPVMHPLDTLKGIGSTIKEVAQDVPQSPFYNPAAQAEQPGPLAQMGKGYAEDWKKSPALAMENAAGDALGTVEGGRMMGGAVETDTGRIGAKFGLPEKVGIKPAIAAIPTRAKAGALLNDVSTAAKGQPITFTRTLPELERAQRLSTWGHGNVTPLDSLYNRINTVNPIDFEEARGRYTPLTRLTASDTMRATPQLQAASKGVAGAMREDIGDTARAVGKGEEYEKGMRMYSRASRNAELFNKAMKYGGRAAAGAAGAGGAYGLYHTLKE